MKQQLSRPGLVLFESALFRTVSTVVHGRDYTLAVDPNWLPREVAAVAAEVARGGRERAFLLFTHSDYDHIIGYGAFPGARTIASAAFADNPDREAVLRQIRDFDDEYYILRDYPITYPTVDHAVAEGTSMVLGDDEYVFYPAPGHNRDGILTHVRNRGILIVGDYLSNAEFPYVYHSFADYRGTLDRIERLIAGGEVRLLITGHGDHTQDRTEMDRRLGESRRYLDELEQSVREGVPFDLERLFRRYRFPKIMGKIHAANLALLRRELAGD